MRSDQIRLGNRQAFGLHIRTLREALHEKGQKGFSLRQVAEAVDLEPSFLSKVERGLSDPPGEEKILRLAEVLGEDPDVLLALAGRVSSETQALIRGKPKAFTALLRALRNAPEERILELAAREVRDGDW